MTTYREYILGEAAGTPKPQKGDVVRSACGRQGPIRRLSEIMAYVDLSDGTQRVSALAPVSVRDLQSDGPSAWKEVWTELIPEGLMVGWDSYLDSDMAADAYAELEDLYNRNKNDPTLKSVFEIWLKRFVVEPYGTDVDLEGWHAIALISKEPLFKEIVQASQLDVRPYMRTALETLWNEEKQGSETIPGPDGLKKLIRWITPWT